MNCRIIQKLLKHCKLIQQCKKLIIYYKINVYQLVSNVQVQLFELSQIYLKCYMLMG